MNNMMNQLLPAVMYNSLRLRKCTIVHVSTEQIYKLWWKNYEIW